MTTLAMMMLLAIVVLALVVDVAALIGWLRRKLS